MRLSILIPTIPERWEKFMRLYNEIKRQINICNEFHPSLGGAEIIYDDTKRFTESGVSVGKKRDNLLKRASGEYLCFVDDDDFVSPNYVETILRLLENSPDVACFNAIFKCDIYWSIIDMSIANQENEQATPHRIVKRSAWHICPVKSSIAKMFSFPDINNAEDWEWFSQVEKKLKHEAKTHAILYQYKHSSKGSAVDNQ